MGLRNSPSHPPATARSRPPPAEEKKISFPYCNSFRLMLNWLCHCGAWRLAWRFYKVKDKELKMMDAIDVKPGRVFTRVVFFMSQNPDSKQWEPMAYFPDLTWDRAGRYRTCYMSAWGHGPCADAYLYEDCKAPGGKLEWAAVDRLKSELETLAMPYELDVVPAENWLEDHAERIDEVRDAIFQICYNKDGEKMLAAADSRRKRA